MPQDRDASPFSDPQYGVAFELFRRLPAEVFDAYYANLDVPLLPSGCLLDVGAGPGLQAEALLSRLPSAWRVVTIEPSQELFAIARQRLDKHGSRIDVRNHGLQDELEVGTYDAAWLSEVVHLLGSASQWTERLAGLLRARGRLLIRTSTHEQLRRREWYRYFPAALEVDLQRHPSREAVVTALAGAGFADISVKAVDETRMVSSDFIERSLRSRAFSTLHYLDQEELERGVRAWGSDHNGRPSISWHYEMTAYTATRRPDSGGL